MNVKITVSACNFFFQEPPQRVENIQEKEQVEETVTEGPAPQAKLLTDKEMNELAAKIMKAELIGNEVSLSRIQNSPSYFFLVKEI